jgi:hypothetical protein
MVPQEGFGLKGFQFSDGLFFHHGMDYDRTKDFGNHG